MNRRSFIQGLAAIAGISTVAKTDNIRISDYSGMKVERDDVIYEISPVNSPFLNTEYIERHTGHHEWVEDELAPFNSDNAVEILEQRLANLQADIDSQLNVPHRTKT